MEPKTFAELGLSPKVQAAVEAAGYTTPTPIQIEAIPIAVTGQDVLGIAQTGTGKTAGFVLPMITRLETGRARARMPRSLILAPTRELAAQCAQAFEKYGVNHKLNIALLIGGVSMDDQIKKLDRGVDVLIATPGRLLDHHQRGRLMLMGVEILVIDEADRMLDMGFIPDIEKICKLLPPRRQTLFFSATMPPEITRLVSQFLKNPIRIEVAPPATTAKTITQRFRYCPDGEDWAKREILRELIRGENVKNAIIFCNRKRDVAILLKSLLKHGFNAGALHGDMDQKSRMETLDKFRSGEITFLAASDVAARGLDIPDVSHVFNFDMPWDADDYVHRIGRTGRAGKEGNSVGLVTADDLKILTAVEKVAGATSQWIGEPPTEQDFAEGGKKRRRGGGRRGVERSSERRDTRRAAGGGESGRRDRGERVRDRGERSRDGARAMEAVASVREPVGAAAASPPARAHEPAAEPVARSEPRQRRPQEARQTRERGSDAPRPRQQREQRPAGEPRQEPARQADTFREERREPNRGGEKRGGGGDRRPEPKGPVGFADNVPAFLRKPPRPQKVKEAT